MSTAEVVICRNCGAETARRTYATRYCLGCEATMYGPRATAPQVRKPVENVAVAEVPQAVAAAPKESRYKSLTEERYAEHLEALRLAGEIQAWRYEAVRFRLADRTTYTPDWMVIFASGAIEFHETKFSWKDRRNAASRVKLKLVAELYKEFRFAAMIRNDAGEWEREDF